MPSPTRDLPLCTALYLLSFFWSSQLGSGDDDEEEDEDFSYDSEQYYFGMGQLPMGEDDGAPQEDDQVQPVADMLAQDQVVTDLAMLAFEDPLEGSGQTADDFPDPDAPTEE